MKLIDVSVPLDASLPTYPGNTPFSLEAIKRIARGESSNVSTLHMSAHAGTHVDAPRHFFDGAPGVDLLPLEMLLGRVRVIEVHRARASARTSCPTAICRKTCGCSSRPTTRGCGDRRSSTPIMSA